MTVAPEQAKLRFFIVRARWIVRLRLEESVKAPCVQRGFQLFVFRP